MLWILDEFILNVVFPDSSLNDIIYVVNPTFTKDHIISLMKQSKLCRAYDGTQYLPGIVGLNNIKANDYCNVVLQVSKFYSVAIICKKSNIVPFND